MQLHENIRIDEYKYDKKFFTNLFKIYNVCSSSILFEMKLNIKCGNFSSFILRTYNY